MYPVRLALSKLSMVVLVALLAVELPVPALSQNAAPASPTTRGGFYASSSAGASYNTSSGWSSDLNSAVGYDISEHFGVEAGMPFYALTSTTRIDNAGQQVQRSHYNSLGDAYLTFNGGRDFDTVNYSATLTATAPTGDREAGISTGRATFNLNNRIEHDFNRVTPFVEGSIGDSLTSTRRYRRAFTTLGLVSELQGGATVDLSKRFSLEGSVYDDVGFGNQKVYSHRVGKGSAGGTKTGKNRPFDLAYLTQGSASLAADHGLAAVFSVHATSRVDAELAYNRSLHYSTDTVSFTVAYRWEPTQRAQR